MIEDKKKGLAKRILGLYKGIRIPWHLLILGILTGTLSTKVSLIFVPYTSKIQTGDLLAEGVIPGYLIYFLVTPLIGIISSIPSLYASNGMDRQVKDKMIGHALRLDMRYYEKSATQMVSWIVQDSGLPYSIIMLFTGFITGAISSYMSITSMTMIDSSLIGLVPAAVVWVCIATWIEGKFMFLRERKGKRARAELTAYLAEHLSFLTQVKQLHTEDEEIARGEKATWKFFLIEIWQDVMSQLVGIFSDSLTNAITIIIYVVGVPLVRDGKIAMPDLVSFRTYFMMAYGAIAIVPNLYTSWKTFSGEAYYLAGLSDAPEEVYERKMSMDIKDQDLVFDNVSFQYGEKPVLQNVSFTIPKGQCTVLVGPNGAGKTTIFKLIERFYAPDAGEIRFGDYPAEDLHLREWRQSMAYVLQEPQLFDGSIRENITYGMDREVSEEELHTAVKLACADEFIAELPGGLDYQIGPNGARLSGGQRQRLAIARAVMLDPAYLLLDEATSNMDIYSERSVMTALARLMEDRTTIMISHNMDLLEAADNVVVLNDGTVEASGDLETVKAKSPTLQKLLGADA